ncbi:MAG TPA: PilN domain-containing protein [Patescibacteria group bacterium]|nr:PilN domain-containing protein [Patescibacteria group bacterium]
MKRYQINLLQQRKKPEVLTDKLIFFALHYLRYIIIITQIIVIGVFFYRFTIDQQVIDLKESVSQKQEIIRTTVPLVNEVRAIETKTTVIKKLIDEQKKFLMHLNYITSIIPESIIISTVSISEQEIALEGKTTDLNSIRSLYERLKKDQKFQTVSLGEVKKDEQIFNFSLKTTL